MNNTDVPRKVFLFSGHMVDAPDRLQPRFPPDKESLAAAAIAESLNRMGTGTHDLAICGAACGGDLLFAEAALMRGARLAFYIPFDEPTFLQNSIEWAGDDWRRRYFLAKPHAKLHVMPDLLGTDATHDNPYVQLNLWMLGAAMRFGPERLEFISLWNGEGGDGPGGTFHLMQEVQKAGGRAHWLDTTKLWEVSR
jgi:hypothetical protein